jgi:hypothetical protein
MERSAITETQLRGQFLFTARRSLKIVNGAQKEARVAYLA